MKHLGILFFLSLLAASCSGPKSSQDVTEEPAALELSEEEDLFAEDDFDQSMKGPEDSFVSAESKPEEVGVIEEVQAEAPLIQEEPMIAEAGQMPVEEKSEMNEEIMEPKEEIKIETVGSLKTYTVDKNDTMMLIAFKIYGDYSKWREILNANSDKLMGKPSNLKAGMELSYYHDGEEFNWNPGGNPYLIKWGDTLGLISDKVYGTKTKWKALWEHNKPMIKDPNKIYAGFTLYYQEDDRGVASY